MCSWLPVPGESVGERARVGQTAEPRRRASTSPSWPTGSPPATTRPGYRRSVTSCGPAHTSCSSSGGCERSRPLSTTWTRRPGGYWWELSWRQVEMSRTIVFDAPRRRLGRFSRPPWPTTSTSAVRDEHARWIFDRQIRSNTLRRVRDQGRRPEAPTVTINAFYKHSRIKEYLKENRALRIETVVNSPTGIWGCRDVSSTSPSSRPRPAPPTRRLLEGERAGQGCAIESAVFERISQPSLQGGPKNRGLGFGDHAVDGPDRRPLRSP